MKYSSIWRTVSAWSLGLLFTGISVFIGIILYILEPFKQTLVHKYITVWARGILFFCFLPITITGKENLKNLGPAVFIANHQSFLDVFLMLGHIKRKASFLAKKQLIWIPVIGQLMWVFGQIFIDRSDPKKSHESVLRCIRAAQNGWSIYVFPEGTRSDDGRIQKFKSGSLKIPLRTGAPVVPITITGLNKVMKKKSKIINKNQVVFHIGEPISTEGMETKDFKAFVESLEQRIRDTAESLYQQYPATAPSVNRSI